MLAAKASRTTEVAPGVTFPRPSKDIRGPSSKRTLASRRRSKTESSVLEETGKTTAVEWVDIEEDPARRKVISKRRASASSGGHKSRNSVSEGDIGRAFGSRLSRILESGEFTAPSSSHAQSPGSRKQSSGGAVRRHRHKEDSSSSHRRPGKHRVGGLSKRPEQLFKVNPSLLSVLSSLTGVSDSSSNTTITQRSYDKRPIPIPEPVAEHQDPKTGSEPVHAESLLNVFDYMEADPSDASEQDSRSVVSDSSLKSSRSRRSNTGSSDRPETPSSRSSIASPTATRNASLTASVSELRRKYDVQYASSAESIEGVERTLGANGASANRSRKRSYVNDEDGNFAPNRSDDGSDGQRSPSTRSSRHEAKLRQQQDALRTHQSIPQPRHHPQNSQHVVQPVSEQHRSHSDSRVASAGSHAPYPQFMAMQHYQHPSTHLPYYSAEQNVHVSFADRPPVPDAPDLSKRTLAGYEMLASELASADSPVKPVYRKFEYLNNRILLHLQDELCEMEEQLRTFDEIIAQMEPISTDHKRQPASRRGESFSGTEMHHQRTQLLGRIFLKTEQYNRALNSFAGLNSDLRPAGAERVNAYRAWLEETAPVHETETKFLHAEGDLVQPGKPRRAPSQISSSPAHPTMNAVALSCLPTVLMLPILLFSIIPTLTGRLMITLLIAIGAFMVATTTRIRGLLSLNEWAICGGAYVLLMASIAGCIPQHGG